jgi:predicted nucleic acid-binding protein
VEKLALPRIRVKYGLDNQAIETTLALLALRGELVQPTRAARVCRDPDDNALIEAALAGGAEYVVTGDEDLLVLKKFETVRIVTPRVFLAAGGRVTAHFRPCSLFELTCAQQQCRMHS